MKATNKTKQMTDLLFDGQVIAIFKVNQKELNWYENLFNTAYVVSKNILPFTDTFKWSSFGQWAFRQGTCVNLIKTISEVLRNNVIDHMKQVWFISIMSDGSTDSFVADQEAILLRYVHEPATVFASIKCLKWNKTSRILYGQVTFFR